MERWHSMTARQVMEKLDSGPEGLSDGEAARRLERDGPNQISPPRRPPLLLRLLGQLQDPMILVLLAAAGLSLAASGGRDWLDGAIILIIVAVNGVLSVTQEDHAHQALEQLRDLSAPMALVIRSGKEAFARRGIGGGRCDPAPGGGPGPGGCPIAGEYPSAGG